MHGAGPPHTLCTATPEHDFTVFFCDSCDLIDDNFDKKECVVFGFMCMYFRVNTYVEQMTDTKWRFPESKDKGKVLCVSAKRAKLNFHHFSGEPKEGFKRRF